jgi:hypothetical protein
MPVSIEQDHGNIHRIRITGLLHKSEMENVQRRATIAIEAGGNIRLLFILDRFEGWEKNAAWGDLKFYLKHGNQIEKIAIIGEEEWRDQALMFAGAGLRQGEVEFFPTEKSIAAVAWLEKQ